MATMCSVCGEKIGGFSGGKPLSPELNQYLICGYCNDQMNAILRDPTSSFFQDAGKYFFDILARRTLEADARAHVEELANQYAKANHSQLKQQEEDFHATREYHDRLANIKLTSGHNFEGWRITEYTQFISSELVVGMGFFKSIFASFSNLLGTESGALTDKLASTKREVQLGLRAEAEKLGCNAIIGADLEYTMFGDSMVGVIMSGTAVKIEPIGGNTASPGDSDTRWGTPEKSDSCDEQGNQWGASVAPAPVPGNSEWGTPEKCESCDAQGDSWGTAPQT